MSTPNKKNSDSYVNKIDFRIELEEDFGSITKAEVTTIAPQTEQYQYQYQLGIDLDPTVVRNNYSYALYVALTAFNFGYIISNLNVINSNLRVLFDYSHFANASLVDSVLTTCMPVGAFLATLMIGCFSHLRPMQSILLGNVITAFGILLSLYPYTHSLWVFCMARVFMGFGIGLGSQMVTYLIGNLCNHRIRGNLSPLFQVMITTGITVSFLISIYYAMKSEDELLTAEDFGLYYYFIFSFPLLTIGLQNYLWYFYFYKYDVYNNEEYKEDIQIFFYGENEANKMKIMDSIGADNDSKNNKNKTMMNTVPKASEANSIKDLLGPRYRYRFLFCLWLALGQQMSGINALIFYSSSIYEKISTDKMFIYCMTLCMGIIGIIGSFASSRLLEKYGRKDLLFNTLVIYSIVMMTLGMLSEYAPNAPLFHVSMGVLSMFQRLFFELGYGPIMSVYFGETLPLLANGYVYNLNWIGAIVISLTTKSMLESELHLAGTYGIFFGFNCITLFLVYNYMVETKGFSRREISQIFKQKSSFENNDLDFKMCESTVNTVSKVNKNENDENEDENEDQEGKGESNRNAKGKYTETEMIDFNIKNNIFTVEKVV